MQKIKELALREFADLAGLEEYLGIPLTAKEVKRKVLRDFKASIKNHMSQIEYDQNSQYFNTIRPLVSALNEDVTPIEVRKETKKLSAKAQRRVNTEVSKHMNAFKEALNGSSLQFEHEIVQQRAIYHLGKYNEYIELIKPTKAELTRAFLTMIRDADNLTMDEAVDKLASFNIPGLNKHHIPHDWKELQATLLTFRTFQQ